MSKFKISRMYLTMQMVADSFDAQDWEFVFHEEGDGPRFSGVQVYYDQTVFLDNQIYLVPKGAGVPEALLSSNAGFIVFENDIGYNTPTAPYIVLPENIDVFAASNCMQLLLQRCHAWEAKLTAVITNDGTLNDLFEVAIEFFENPIYIHDSFFNILSQPVWVHGMLPLEINSITGRKMIPLDLVNEFKTSDDYIDTLDKEGAQVWDIDQVCYGMRSLFVNIWDHGKYRARILLNELNSVFTKTTEYALEYFAEYVKLILRRDMGQDNSTYTLFEDVLRAYMIGENADLIEMRRCINTLDWNIDDRYVCLKMSPGQPNLKVQSIYAMCSSVDIKLKHSISFIHENTICSLVNMTKSKLTLEEIGSQLAPIIRDSLFYCGTSNSFSPIFMLNDAFHQADISLSMVQRYGSTQWYLSFADCALEYILSLAENELPAELFCAPELKKLREIDREKGTEYFHTLKTYLFSRLDINATAKALFIHRTTLCYRLEKIGQLIPMKFDNAHYRLYLQLSALIIEHSDKVSEAVSRARRGKLPEEILKDS